jgi:sulfite reductase alpha subunit-like flavoprotein
MIGAGTGMAPFRGFIQEFKAEGGKRTKTMFFFGCRRSDEDFLYKEELNDAVEGKYLSELITAFSREQAHKVYVQDRLRERSEEIGKLLLDEGAYLYICGSHTMGKSVNEVLANALGSKDQLDRLQKDGHIVEELW